MTNKTIDQEAQDRQAQFLAVFHEFETIGEGARWVAQATGCSVATVMIWRSKGASTYPIPRRAHKLLMDAVKRGMPASA